MSGDKSKRLVVADGLLREEGLYTANFGFQGLHAFALVSVVLPVTARTLLLEALFISSLGL